MAIETGCFAMAVIRAESEFLVTSVKDLGATFAFFEQVVRHVPFWPVVPDV
jgi:hypothetical protein